MTIPEADAHYLAERGLAYEIHHDQGMTCLLLPNWSLPLGYDRDHADLLLRLSPGYPDIAPDMWWFEPAVRRADGGSIPGTESHEPYLGRTWQRWSRHFQPGQWHTGVDGLESFLALIKSELVRCALGSVA